MLREPTVLERLNDLETCRIALQRILRENASGDINQIRVALVDIKNFLQRKDISVEDAYGDFSGEGEA